MNGDLKYQQSVASEFIAIKDRVRYFINDRHWGEDGKYKEIILMNYLRKVLPNNVSVGTGFIRNRYKELTRQIDIIIYKDDLPKLFIEGDFVILMPESVLGIIEVKSKSTLNVLTSNSRGPSTIEKAEENGKIIGRRDIFNGIFAYDNEIKFNDSFTQSKIAEQLKETKGYLNHLSLGSNNFLRYWENGNPVVGHRRCFSAYRLSYSSVTGKNDNDMPGFSYGYFISNLLEYIYKNIASDILNDHYFEFLYPLEGTKERYRVEKCEVYLTGEEDY